MITKKKKRRNENKTLDNSAHGFIHICLKIKSLSHAFVQCKTVDYEHFTGNKAKCLFYRQF